MPDVKAPVFYNCWNKNVVCAFKTDDGDEFFATFGKHSEHFPLYGASYDNVMLYNRTKGVGYGLTVPVMLGLETSLEGNRFRVAYRGDLTCYDGGRAGPSVPVAVDLQFQAQPTRTDLFFLKRLLPIRSRFIPGAIFNNKIIRGAGPGSITIGGIRQGVSANFCSGHLENGQSSLLTRRAWVIPYRYLGLLKDDSTTVSFYFNWAIHPFKARTLEERLVNQVKKRIKKEVLYRHDGRRFSVSHRRPEDLDTEYIRELFINPFPMGEFGFSRSFIEASGPGASRWYGILEDFTHPDINGLSA
ncbi:MAG: hypothetical protein HYT79_06180 [Elusimicrobia bacterium]|nr:hypothetical protein [Elusimicrobiota bacterium]